MTNRAGIVTSVGVVGMRMVVRVGLMMMEGLETTFLVTASFGTEELGVLAVDIVKVHVHVRTGLAVSG